MKTIPADGAYKAVQGRDGMTRSFARSVNAAIDTHRSNGQPVARYDAAKKKAYLEYADGSRRYVE